MHLNHSGGSLAPNSERAAQKAAPSKFVRLATPQQHSPADLLEQARQAEVLARLHLVAGRMNSGSIGRQELALAQFFAGVQRQAMGAGR
jgi:hypothetical protein